MSKLNSPVDCLLGRAAKGATPVIRTKTKKQAVTLAFLFWYVYVFLTGVEGGSVSESERFACGRMGYVKEI
jgi:hypothetical protein